MPAKSGEIGSEVLGILSLVFSCLFMLELIASVWAFGRSYVRLTLLLQVPGTYHVSYFSTPFHCLDATVILAGFVLDVLLKGIVEEVGSLVVVLRLWRVFKIIEELSAGAEERMEPLQEKVEELEEENRMLKSDVDRLITMQQVVR